MVVVVVASVVVMTSVLEAGTTSIRYRGVVVVKAVVVATGVKQEQASERTELGTPLRSNSHVKLGHGTYKKEPEPLELQRISSST